MNHRPTKPRAKASSIILSLFGVVLLATAGLLVFHNPTPVKASSATLTFTPSADSYTNPASPTTNYGTSTQVRTDGSPLVHAYLRFNVTGITTSTINSITLRLYANSASSNGLTVNQVTDNSWQESQINATNAPAIGTKVGTSKAFSANTWVSINVTPLLTADGTVSIALVDLNATAISLASRETGAHAPQLLVQTTTAATATALPSATTLVLPTDTSSALPGPTATNPPAPGNPPSGDYQPAFPIRAAFYYPWFPEAWNQQGYNPFTNYTPSLGYYDSSTTTQAHISAMTYGNIQAGILSWWGQGSATDQRVSTILSATPGSSNPNFRWSIYYENESMGDPSLSQIESDLTYIGSAYGNNASFLKVKGKFVIFVYADANDGCSMAGRWVQADNALGHPAYIVLKVFVGYTACASQPDSWHQYSPAVVTDDQKGYSYAISPGFYKKGEASPRLVRNLTTWTADIKAMVASNEPWQLVTTFNEWGEGTSVESAAQWGSASGYGQYLDALHANGNGTPPPQPTATPQSTNPPAATSTGNPTGTALPTNPPASSTTPTRAPTGTQPPQPTASATATKVPTATLQPSVTTSPTHTPPPTLTPTGNPTQAPTATRVPPTPTQPAPTATQSSNLTPVALTKGPDLLYSGSNTQQKIFWQWTANTTFRVDWGTSTSYGSSSPAISAYDSTNHLYAYTITGLTPGTHYSYRLVMGSQYSGGSFLTAPADNATAINFVSYGDNRTNPSIQNNVAGLVDQLYQSDPSYQTFNLVCGDLVSNGDTDSTWTSEMFSSSLTNIRTELANLSYLPIMGNHEGSGSLFQRYFPQPYVAAAYWSFDYGPVHVVMMDQYVSYSTGSAEYNWVKSDLAATTKKWKVVMFHEPGYSANGGHPDNTTIQTVYEPLFEQYQVALTISGHNHYYARAMVNGIPELTVGTGGAPLYTPQSGQLDVVKTWEGNGYEKISINGNTLTAWFISSSGSLIDTFSVTR